MKTGTRIKEGYIEEFLFIYYQILAGTSTKIVGHVRGKLWEDLRKLWGQFSIFEQ